MSKNYSQILVGIIIGLLAGLIIGKFVFSRGDHSAVTNGSSSAAIESKEKTSKGSSVKANGEVPQKAISVLNYVKVNGEPMDGFVGGRTFSNREKLLPETDESGNRIKYQEWDVNPKVNGQNRGTERICTGSDGRSWYTNDHYRTFTEIKE
ncbi:MAG: ribonuclease domain-containing protein [Pyrinomonadaceae bacterium]